jgi:hypothetical protein
LASQGDRTCARGSRYPKRVYSHIANEIYLSVSERRRCSGVEDYAIRHGIAMRSNAHHILTEINIKLILLPSKRNPTEGRSAGRGGVKH